MRKNTSMCTRRRPIIQTFQEPIGCLSDCPWGTYEVAGWPFSSISLCIADSTSTGYCLSKQAVQ